MTKKCLHYVNIFRRLYYLLIRRVVPCNECGKTQSASAAYCCQCAAALPTRFICRVGVHRYQKVAALPAHRDSWTREAGVIRCRACGIEAQYEEWRDPDTGYEGTDRFWRATKEVH